MLQCPLKKLLAQPLVSSATTIPPTVIPTCPPGLTLRRSQNYSIEPLSTTVIGGVANTYLVRRAGSSDCLMRLFSTEDARRCLAQRRLVFVGDSTLQELANELLALLRPAASVLPGAGHAADWCLPECVARCAAANASTFDLLRRPGHAEPEAQPAVCDVRQTRLPSKACMRCFDTARRGVEWMPRGASVAFLFSSHPQICSNGDLRQGGLDTFADLSWRRILHALLAAGRSDRSDASAAAVHATGAPRVSLVVHSFAHDVNGAGKNAKDGLLSLRMHTQAARRLKKTYIASLRRVLRRLAKLPPQQPPLQQQGQQPQLRGQLGQQHSPPDAGSGAAPRDLVWVGAPRTRRYSSFEDVATSAEEVAHASGWRVVSRLHSTGLHACTGGYPWKRTAQCRINVMLLLNALC